MLLRRDVSETCVEKLEKLVSNSILNGQRRNYHYLKEIGRMSEHLCNSQGSKKISSNDLLVIKKALKIAVEQTRNTDDDSYESFKWMLWKIEL